MTNFDCPMKPQRIQLRRKCGFNLQGCSQNFNGLPAVHVARPGKWGNPFKVESFLPAFDGLKDAQAMAQAAAVQAFRQMLKDGRTAPFNLADIRIELRGKNLACWCKPGTPCHADVLLEIANA